MRTILLSGLAVVLIATLLPVLLPIISPVLGGLDLSWLADGNITLGEVVAFIGAILIAVAKRGEEKLLQARGINPSEL